MKLGFVWPQTAAAAPDARLLELLSEFIDANADTVQLITGHEQTELECLAHCDYLRALQRSATRHSPTTTSACQHRHSRSPSYRDSTRLSSARGRLPSSSCAVPPGRLRRCPDPHRPAVSTRSCVTRRYRTMRTTHFSYVAPPSIADSGDRPAAPEDSECKISCLLVMRARGWFAPELADVGPIRCPVGERRRACPEHEAAVEVALQLEPPWRVVSSNLDFARRRVDLRLGVRAGSRFPCPQCGRACQAVEFTEGTWRQPDMMAFEAFVTARLPSIRCSEHGDVALTPSWANDHVSLQAVIREANTDPAGDTSADRSSGHARAPGGPDVAAGELVANRSTSAFAARYAARRVAGLVEDLAAGWLRALISASALRGAGSVAADAMHAAARSISAWRSAARFARGTGASQRPGPDRRRRGAAFLVELELQPNLIERA